MKSSKFASLMMIGLALTMAVSGCKKRPGAVTPLPKGGLVGGPNDVGPGKPIGSENGTESTEPKATPLADPSQYENWNRNPDVLKAETIYFAYDSSSIRSTEKSKLAHVADYMKANPGSALEVDGHCDERGTEEYNRALGERRALSGRDELIRLGVDGSRIITKSYGKDRPIEPLHSEAAWSRNRRDEFVVLTPPK